MPGFALCLVAMTMPAAFAQSGHVPMSVGTPTVDANGVKYYPVKSVYQGSQQQIIRVLEPTNPAPGKPPRLLYVLPVDPGVDTLSSAFSDGLEELRLLDVQDRFNMTLIAPSFGYDPWYGDNILDGKQTESFIIEDLVPFGDTFANGGIPQRFLIGFSKSGNGALDLILRHPGVFNEAAIWDSPTQLSSISSYADLLMNFGSQANFNSYNIPALVSSNAGPFQQQTRLWISGDQADYQPDMIELHNELIAASIPHTWVQGGVRAHSWNSGWLDGAVTSLDAMATATPPSAGTLPPPRSGGQPAWVLPATTSQVTMSLVTDENATCRYATTGGVPYALMGSTFSTTGGTAHSTVLTGLTSGSNYSYYVRCEDTAGNTNLDDYVIAFAVSGTGATVSSTFTGVELALSDGMWDTPGSWQPMSENNGAYATGVGAARVANPLFNPDQYAEITYDHDPGSNWVGVMTRMQGSTNGSGYLAFAYAGKVWLYRVDDNGTLNWNELVSASVDVSVAPRDLRLESQGSTHRVIFNGVLLISYTDPNNVYTSGQPGIAVATFSTIQTFSGGNLPRTPVRSGGQPGGVLPATTSQVTMSLVTDENATCRYATTAGVPYGSMPNAFSTTGGTAHSTVLTGLTSGSNYSYYVRCQDAAGNADTDDYVIAFAVSSTATTASDTFAGVAATLSDNGLWSTPGSWQPMSENNGAYATGTDAAQVANPLLNADQYAEITYDHDPGTSSWVGVMTRMQGPANGGGYLAFAYAGKVWLYRVDDNGTLNWNELVAASVDVSVAPRDLRLESQGSTHRVIFNGVLLITYTDPNNVYTSGQPGIAAAGFSTIQTFSGGNLPRTPVRSGGQPTGVLPATTSQVTMSLVTDENATCRYATTAGVPYGSMPNAFSTTGGTAQSTVLTGLASGSNYSYYVRCQDAAGNADTYDYAIAFGVSSTATTVSDTFTGVATILSDNGLWSTPGSWQPMSENNGAYATGTDAAQVTNPLLNADQYAEITYDHDPGSNWVGVMTRMQGPANGGGYLAFAYAGQVRLYRVDDNGTLNWNELVAASVDVSVAPRDLRLESQGSTHRVIFNGVLLITYTDPNNVYTSGQPGIAAAGFSTIQTFSGGNLPRTPVRSGGQPGGVLAATTSQVTMSLVTDENATCRYATTAGVPYGSMGSTFSTTGGTAHSTVLTGLTSGSNYSYYVRCEDAAGNADTYDYAIAFGVSSTATTVSDTFAGVAATLSDNGLWSTPGSWQPISENNGAYATGTDAAQVTNPLFNPDQYAEITYDHDPGNNWVGVMTRMQGPANGGGYLAFAYAGQVRLYRVDDNGTLNWNELVAASADVSVAPRDLRLESQGNTHRVIFNGVLLISYTDPNNVYTSGQPGIAAAGFSTIQTFSGGNLLRTPVRSGGQPAGVLPATTSQVTMSLVTDENATCRYATTGGVPYASMGSTFSTTGGTAHSTVLTGLTSGSNYSYYVRCQDAAGNADTYDYAIAFGVSSTATTVSDTFTGVATILSDNGLWSTPGSWQPMSENNGAYATGTDAAQVTNPLFNPDQYAEITYDHDPGSNWVGVMTRMQGPANGGGYLAFAYAGQVRLYRVDDNGTLNWNELVAASVDVSVAPRDLRLESQGNTHRVIFNGVLLITYTDPNNVYTSGQPGIAAAGFSTIQTFSGGNL